jgi:hypothetical protein
VPTYFTLVSSSGSGVPAGSVVGPAFPYAGAGEQTTTKAVNYMFAKKILMRTSPCSTQLLQAALSATTLPNLTLQAEGSDYALVLNGGAGATVTSLTLKLKGPTGVTCNVPTYFFQ